MTYADKYALMKAYKISTGDDPDQNASVETHYSRVQAGAYKPKNPTPRQALVARLDELGIDVKEYADKHGLGKDTPPDEFLKCLEELKNR
jgi:hypothetical protein